MLGWDCQGARPSRERPASPTSVPARTAAGTDPIERLQKLADLKDRGVLTDSEFAAEKAKILSES
jgi:hypothetical protein